MLSFERKLFIGSIEFIDRFKRLVNLGDVEFTYLTYITVDQSISGLTEE